MRRRQALLGTACAATSAAALLLVPAGASAPQPALKQTGIPTAGVALEVPSGWISSPATGALRSQHVVAVFAAPVATGGFRANLNVIVADIPQGVSLRKWLLGNEGARYLRLGKLRAVTIHGAHGYAYTSSRLERYGGKPLLLVEYAFNRGSRGYLFTYTTMGAPAAGRALFDASAATIDFVAVPPSA